MKEKKAKLYVTIEDRSSHNVTAISANKISSLNEHLPTEEALKTHLQLENIKVIKGKDYKPKPLYIYIEGSIFEQIISEIKKKDKRFNEFSDRIELKLQSHNLPIVVLYRDQIW